MENKKRYNLKTILLTICWIVLGGAVIFLLASSIKAKAWHRCIGVDIDIHGVSNNYFVDKKDILQTIAELEKTNPVGKAIGSFNLKLLETELEKNVWIKSAELFFDNNEILRVSVQEREPVARVFTTTAATFYIDNELMMLPLSEKFSARLPVFTGFPSDSKVLSKADSNLLMQIKTISQAIQKDSFSLAMIDQIDITPQRSFEMIPKIGRQLIVFGDAADVELKLKKLKLFYKEVMLKAGWNKYSVINVQYKNQVVAKIRGAEDVTADSIRTLQIMQMLAERAERMASDSLLAIQMDPDRNTVDSTMILQSIQRDELETPAAAVEKTPVDKSKAAPEGITTEKKSNMKSAEKNKQVTPQAKQPKAIMNNNKQH